MSKKKAKINTRPPPPCIKHPRVQFQLGVAYKNVAYENKACFLKNSCSKTFSIYLVKGAFTLQFSDNFFNYRKAWFYVNGVNDYFIILYIFPNISF